MPFNQNYEALGRIKFKIDDVVGNAGYSSVYTVKIDATNPPAPVISSLTHPDEGVDALINKRFKLDVYACTCD